MLAVPHALAGPVPEAGAVAAVLLVALALVARRRRTRALAMSGALLLAPVLLVADIWYSPQMRVVRDHPLPAGGAAVAALAVVALLAVAMARRPLLLPVLAVVALPFRIPIEVGGETANLLVPLYLVIAAGALAFVVPALAADPEAPEPADDGAWAPGWLERLLALSVVLYGVQATYSADFDRALQQLAFFYVPFALLFVLLAQITWSARLLRACFAVLVGLALAFCAVGYVEYATRHVFLNPKLIAANELHTYFRTNSVFFDPNIYGRFLVVAMLAVAALLLRTAQARRVWAGAAVLAALWAGLVLTLSQSSYVALLAGLATLAVLQWGWRRTAAPVAGVLALGVALVLVAPGAVGVDLGNLDAATSGRAGLVEGGGRLFLDAPLAGHGAGAFERAYAARHRAPADGDAAVASHTIPITVAAEQGAIGLAAYLALLAAALARLLRGAGASPARAAVAAAFVALVVHTLVYAAFLEDPMTWALLGIGAALAAQAARAPRRRAGPQPVAQQRPRPVADEREHLALGQPEPERRARRRRQRRRPARAVGVGGDHAGVAAGQQPHRVAARAGAVEADDRRGADLRDGAELELAPQRAHVVVEQGRAPLGVGEHDAEAAGAQLVGAAVERADGAVERRLEQDPAGVRRAVRDRLQLRVGQLPDAPRRDLAAGLHLELDAGGAQRRVDLRHARRDLLDRDRADVRGRRRADDPVGDREPRELDRRGEVGRAVVDARQQVHVQVDEAGGARVRWRCLHAELVTTPGGDGFASGSACATM